MSSSLARSLGHFLTIRGFATVAVLTLAWTGLWRDISLPNILSGAALSALALTLGTDTGRRGGLRPWPLLRLFGVVVVDLVESTINVAAEAITPGDGTDEAIVEIQLDEHAKRHFLLLLICVTLTPGTAVVDADPETGAMYLHMLDRGRVDKITDHVHALAELADQALPVAADHHLESA